MIFTESTIKISNNVSKMDSTIVLYRGDKNVEIRFTILQSPFKYSNTVSTNVIESTNASYGQLVIKTPNDKPPIFSEVSATKEGTVLFTITKEMIDEIEEVGVYTFQIRLMDENKQSRVTIPPVENGIEIKEPIAIEDDNTTNVVGLAKANYAVATLSDVDIPAFDDNGKYIKTNWNDGDVITNASLNKIEDGIYTTNENVTATKKYVDDGINYNNKQFNNRIVAMNISKHPVSCSTEIYKKPLCDIFPELLNITYNTVFKESNSFKVNMDNFVKEYPTVKSAYNKLNINLYDENDNSIGNSYGNSINGEGLNIIFINITESLRFYAYFDKALVDGSSTTMETKNGYMTIQLLIPKDNNKQEFIDKIKNLKLTLSVIRTDFLNLNNETIYTPTTDYNPATKKYVDDNKIAYTISSKVLTTVPASDIKLDGEIAVNNISINKDRKYYIEFLGSKKLCSLAISEKTGNSIACSIGNYNIQAFNSSTNIVINIEKINEDDTTATTFTDLVIYEEEVKYLDSKYLETDLVLQNSVSLGRVGNIGTGSSAVGGSVTASGMGSHAEGVFTIASGDTSHAEGESTTASGMSSHTEGNSTTASGENSHAEGASTIASSQNQHVQGKCNIEDTNNKYAHIVGNGEDGKNSNAHTLDWEGNAWFAGKLTQEGTPTEGKDLTTKKYVDDNILLEQLPILRIDETNKRIYVNCNNMGTYKKYFVPNKYANVYGFSFIYTNEDSSETEIALIGGAMTRDDFILCARNTNTLFILILGGTNKYTYTKSTKTLEKSLYGYLKIGNTQEYAPTENYHPATKKYVDDKVSNLPQFSFNDAGELVVTINGVSKTFVPKNV